MVNKNKRKGDWAEKVAAEFAKSKGFNARRTKAGYERDYGDIHLNPFTLGGAIIQVKNVATPEWNKWLNEQLPLQAEEAKAEIAFILNKRPGQGEAKVGDWLAVMRYEDMLKLINEYQDMKYHLADLNDEPIDVNEELSEVLEDENGS